MYILIYENIVYCSCAIVLIDHLNEYFHICVQISFCLYGEC